jgi:hypothetical protein
MPRLFKRLKKGLLAQEPNSKTGGKNTICVN